MKGGWGLKEEKRNSDSEQAAARRGSQTWEPLYLVQEKRAGGKSEMGGQECGGGREVEEGWG